MNTYNDIEFTRFCEAHRNITFDVFASYAKYSQLKQSIKDSDLDDEKKAQKLYDLDNEIETWLCESDESRRYVFINNKFYLVKSEFVDDDNVDYMIVKDLQGNERTVQK